MKQLAQIDLRKDDLIVMPFSKTIPGFWIGNGHYERLSSDASSREIGRAVDHALSETQHGVAPPPREDPVPIQPILDELGLNFGSYMKGARCVQVRRDGSSVEVNPTRNEGAKGGFVPLTDQAEQLTDPSTEELGESIRRAFDKAS